MGGLFLPKKNSNGERTEFAECNAKKGNPNPGQTS
jgi:hypothetical protein